MPTELSDAEAEVLARSLRRRLEADSGQPHELVETHISRVLLGPQFAYKLKKPVRVGFLDFGTRALRRRYCDEEVRLNRRLAPMLYLGVVDVCGSPEDASFGGPGKVIDCAVKMSRFGDEALLSRRLGHGEPIGPALDEFAARLAAFHRQAPAADPGGPWGAPEAQLAAVRAALRGTAVALGAGAAALDAWLERQALEQGPLLVSRLRGGKVREGHGDLHLANLVALPDGVTAFDCIEFDPALRWIDVLDDAAFLVMDLCAQGHRDLGFRFLNAYLDHSGEHEGLGLLRLYMVYRALVRAQVALLRAAQGGRGGDGALRYLDLAVSLTQPPRPRLLITHGLPGSGKTFVSQALLERCGAVRLRSDVERKRLHGLGPLEASAGRVPGGIYGAQATRLTYERLERLARVSLAAGYPTIVDAAFLQRNERDRFAALAHEAGCPFALLHCDAPLPVLRARVLARQTERSDASEADAEVLERLHAAQQPLDADERALALDGGGDACALAAHWCDGTPS